LISPNRNRTFSFNVTKARSNAAVSSPKQDTSKEKGDVRENFYQLLDFALDLVGFNGRPHLYLRRTTIGEWRRKENSSGSWLEIKITTWTSNIELRSFSTWWRQTLIHSDESKFLCDYIWCHFTDLKEYEKQCGIWCLCSCGRTWFPIPFNV